MKFMSYGRRQFKRYETTKLLRGIVRNTVEHILIVSQIRSVPEKAHFGA